jgi:hypothetical protein
VPGRSGWDLQEKTAALVGLLLVQLVGLIVPFVLLIRGFDATAPQGLAPA